MQLNQQVDLLLILQQVCIGLIDVAEKVGLRTKTRRFWSNTCFMG